MGASPDFCFGIGILALMNGVLFSSPFRGARRSGFGASLRCGFGASLRCSFGASLRCSFWVMHAAKVAQPAHRVKDKRLRRAFGILDTARWLGFVTVKGLLPTPVEQG